MRVIVFVLAAFIGITALATTPVPAQAETLTFNVRSNHQYRVQVEFYSQWRNAAWPGNNQAYVIADYDVHTYTLNCQSGEQICYGAWVDGNASTYWGVGLNDQYRCSNCCFVCNGGSTAVINLNP